MTAYICEVFILEYGYIKLKKKKMKETLTKKLGEYMKYVSIRVFGVFRCLVMDIKAVCCCSDLHTVD